VKNLTPTDAARTASLALGRSPYSKGAEKLAADLGAKPTATLVNTRMEVPSPRNGRPAYRWVDGCYVVRPDGTKEFPPVRIREAWSRCASEGWAFKVVSESEYKEQTVTTKHTPGPWNANYREQTGWTADIPNGDRLKTTEANARLIAAAPELLEACAAAFRDLTNSRAITKGYDTGKDCCTPEAQVAIEMLRLALAKATKGGGEA